MRILLVHERYQQRGGEDEVFETESRLLKEHGHEVRQHVISNDEIDSSRPLSLAVSTVWNQAAARSLEGAIDTFAPDVAHFHNTFPLLSPAVYSAAKRRGVPVVKTHHNYRLLCTNALLFREGRVCESCVGSLLPWKGVIHGCYRKSRAASGVVAATVGIHRAIGTWRRDIDVHIALTDFAREKLVTAGIPRDRIVVKPNFVHPDPGPGSGGGEYALFVGRLSEEKGIRTLLDAWKTIGTRLPVRIVGDGPLSEIVGEAARSVPGVEWLGRQPRERIDQLMRAAECVILPSACFEGLSRVLIESYAVGTPVVASRLGAMQALVEPNVTGLHFRASDPADLVKVLTRELARQDGFTRMRKSTRAEFERNYTNDVNYQLLMDVYRRAGLTMAALPRPAQDTGGVVDASI